MKKAFDQTVRDLKREVNKKVLKVPVIEQKILDATSNEPWGPHGSLLADIAQATRNYHEYQIIMAVLWKRINDTGKNWRHVYKGLTILDYLVAHGSERVIDEIREHAYQIATLSDFQYIDSSGKDQGINVRKKSQSIVALVNDKDRIQEVRQKAHANKDKYRSTFSTGGMHRPGSFSGSGSYGDHYDDDHYHGYGNRDDDRNGYGRDRDGGYRDDDRYAKGGDSYSRDGDERYSRDGYRNDEYRGSRGNDDYQFGSRNRSIDRDRDRDRSFDEDDRYSSRSGGGRIDEPSHDDRQTDRKFSEKSPGAPPSYEEAMGEPHNHVQDERDGGAQAPAPKEPSSLAHKASSPSANISDGQTPVVVSAGMPHSQKEANAFDEFDPRSSTTGTSSGTDPFGLSAVDSINSLALVPVTDAASEAHMPNSDFGTNLSSTSYAFNQPSEDPFGDSPFKAIPQDNNASAVHQSFASATSFHAPTGSISSSEAPPAVNPMVESLPSFGSGNSVHAAMTVLVNGHVASSATEIMPSELAALPPSTVSLENLHPYTGITSIMPSQVLQSAPAASSQPTSANILSQSGLSVPPASQAYHPSFLSQMGLSAPVLSQASPYPFSQQGLAPVAPVSQPFLPNHLSQPGQPSPVPIQAAPNVLSQPGFSVSVGPQATPPTMLSQPGLSASGAPGVPVTMFTQGGLSAGVPKVPEAMFSQAGASGASQPDPATTGPPAKSSQPKDNFETKSTVWADTLSRGLVNLNISGPKINPLADIGIDFDTMNRMEKRREKDKSSAAQVSTVSMGKAMGAGSGVGRAGAMGLAPSSNPIMGSGMAMGMGTGNMGMGMAGMGGYAGGMNQSMGMGMGMNMGMGQGAPVRPPTGMPLGPGMPGIGYNPMTGMGAYGSQQYGGYR